jgi:hypothetical protein
LETPPTDSGSADDPTEKGPIGALPAMRRTRQKGLYLVAAVCAATMTVAAMVWKLGFSAKFSLAVILLGAFAVMIAAAWVRAQHENTVMPILARAFGLRYDGSATHHFASLPQTFIPPGKLQGCDDLMSGLIVDRNYRFAEVKTATGGKNSQTLFDGVVIEVATRKSLPALRILPISETLGLLMWKSRLDVTGMTKVFSAPGPGQDFGLWVEQPQDKDALGLRRLMEEMMCVAEVLPGGRLFAVACTCDALFIAISYQPEMFTIGGLFANDESVIDDVRRVSAEFAVPAHIAAQVMRAEENWITAMEGGVGHPA